MRLRVLSSLFVLANLTAVTVMANAQMMNFETQGCGRFQPESYYRTEFHYVNVCLSAATRFMVVTDNDGLSRERVPVDRQGDRYEGISERGNTYTIDGRTLTISLKGLPPTREQVLQSKLASDQLANRDRYDCKSQVQRFSDRFNVTLAEAEQLAVQRDGNRFAYQCVPAAAAKPTASVTGTVTYLQKIALPPTAVVEVKLQDVSLQDGPAVTIAQQTISLDDRQVPVPFTLLYDPTQIDPRRTYAVQARILVAGQLRFINTITYPVITNGRPTQVNIVVDPVSSTQVKSLK
jgi:uncharacterized lipoprotein YbaY